MKKMIAIAVLMLGVCFARADSDVKITLANGGTSIDVIAVDNPPPNFNDNRELRFTVDGKKKTEAEVAALVWSGERFRLCDTADHFALFTVHTSPDGTVNYWHSDGVFRPSKPTSYDAKPTAKASTITDVHGNTYTLGSDGYYRKTAPSAPSCPNGRCPLK